jgi:hypothetical protein
MPALDSGPAAEKVEFVASSGQSYAPHICLSNSSHYEKSDT